MKKARINQIRYSSSRRGRATAQSSTTDPSSLEAMASFTSNSIWTKCLIV